MIEGYRQGYDDRDGGGGSNGAIHEVSVRKATSPVRTVELLEFLADRGQGR